VINTPKNTWARLLPRPEFGGLPGVFSTHLEWALHDLDFRPQMLDLGELRRQIRAGEVGDGGTTELPHLTRLGVDVGQGADIRIIESEPGVFTSRPRVLVEAEFPDPHPGDWVTAMANASRVLLVVGPEGPETYPNPGTWQETWRVATVNTVTYLTADGVGITP